MQVSAVVCGNDQFSRPARPTDIGEPRLEYAGHTRAWNTRSDYTEPVVVDSEPVSLEFGPPVGFGL